MADIFDELEQEIAETDRLLREDEVAANVLLLNGVDPLTTLAAVTDPPKPFGWPYVLVVIIVTAVVARFVLGA